MTISEKLKLIAENELQVYAAGYKKGKDDAGGDVPVYNGEVEVV